jgi:ABC-type dipeptide/oligopeptide/nickel transport system ATPase component/ABC-type dipeptide/oligopeptide/nickel transport system permease subunit
MSAVEVTRSSLFKRLLKNPVGVITMAYLSLILLIAIFAPLLTSIDPTRADIIAVLQGPSGAHWLGTDSAGRDTLARLLFGARTTLIAASLSSIVAILIGVPTGLLAGYYAGKFDTAASWVANMFMSLPALIVLLAVRAAVGPSIFFAMAVFGVLIAPSFFRLTRTAVMGVRNELYVDAARVSGLSDTRIISKHILTVVRAPIIIQAAIVCGVSISLQSGLEFLGLGDASMISWGVMLNEGFRNIYMAPLLIIWPAIAIALTIASFALLGNAVRDGLEDSQKIFSKTEVKKPEFVNEKYAPSNHLLEVKNIGIGYPQASGEIKEVVRQVSFHVDRGEVLGIVGESGSGKTQSAFSILGLLPSNAVITSGAIFLEGKPLLDPNNGKISLEEMTKLRGKKIAYIPQEPMSNLDPNFKIGYQLVRPMVKVLGLTKVEAKAKALKMLETVGIKNPERVFESYPHQVSGGMAQRILIAGAISCDPELLIADEPTTALDVTVQAEVLDLLRDLQKKFGMGMVLVTHNFGVVADLCDRVVVMQHGRIVEGGDVRSILRNPQDPYTQTLLGSMLEGKEPMTFLTTSAKEQS